jgi:hypothetical protein
LHSAQRGGPTRPLKSWDMGHLFRRVRRIAQWRNGDLVHRSGGQRRLPEKRAQPSRLKRDLNHNCRAPGRNAQLSSAFIEQEELGTTFEQRLMCHGYRRLTGRSQRRLHCFVCLRWCVWAVFGPEVVTGPPEEQRNRLPLLFPAWSREKRLQLLRRQALNGSRPRAEDETEAATATSGLGAGRFL